MLGARPRAAPGGAAPARRAPPPATRAPGRLPARRGAAAPPPPRVASNQISAPRLGAPDPSNGAAAAGAAASGCPFSALKAQLTGAAAAPAGPHSAGDAMPAPGPPPFSLQSLSDVGTIFFEGLHVAMLKFSEKYGPVCRCGEGFWGRVAGLLGGCARKRLQGARAPAARPPALPPPWAWGPPPRRPPPPPQKRFANPASLNGATSWLFLNSPDNVQHVCATNVKNYNMRYLPVGGFGGSGGRFWAQKGRRGAYSQEGVLKTILGICKSAWAKASP
jgi:hypothetical protein